MTFPQYLKKVIAKKLHPLYRYRAEEVFLCKEKEKQRQEAEADRIRKEEQEAKRNEQVERLTRKVLAWRLVVRNWFSWKDRKGERKGWHLAARNLKNVKK